MQKLKEIHNSFQLNEDKISCELPEQLMVVNYLDKNARVLELGSNVGRNTHVIATILEDSKNLVTLEPNPNIYSLLLNNKQKNPHLHFHTECYALSKRQLMQKAWVSVPLKKPIPAGYFRIDTITFDELQKKYNIIFDTIVIDCEGALYHILVDDHTILKNIRTIIIENDYLGKEHKKYVDEVFRKYGLSLVYNEALHLPRKMFCKDNFYQVWKLKE